MCAQFSPEEEALFEKISTTVLRRLRKTSNPGDLLSVLASAFKDFDRAFATAPLAARQTIACHAGCDTCCHEVVSVQAHEVLIAAHHVQTHFPPSELEAVIERAAAHRAAFAGRSSGERAVLKKPCVLLREGSCSIYSARPEVCRSHHSHNAAACRTNLDLGREEIDVYVYGVRGRMYAVMLAIDQAVADAGFDGEAYDFGSALHEALTNSLCVARWIQRLPAFPESCREAPGPDDEDSAATHEEEDFH